MSQRLNAVISRLNVVWDFATVCRDISSFETDCHLKLTVSVKKSLFLCYFGNLLTFLRLFCCFLTFLLGIIILRTQSKPIKKSQNQSPLGKLNHKRDNQESFKRRRPFNGVIYFNGINFRGFCGFGCHSWNQVPLGILKGFIREMFLIKTQKMSNTYFEIIYWHQRNANNASKKSFKGGNQSERSFERGQWLFCVVVPY